MQQAQAIAERQGLEPQWVRATLAKAQHLPGIAKLMLPAPGGTAKNWRIYRSRFVEPVRIAAGVKFAQANREWLQRAEDTYGVPADIIVGIIGVETIYGQQMGHYRVIDALATLAFDFPTTHPRAPARQAFFQAELEQFLSLTHSSDPFAARGSYAGAMGLGQFMPSSWAKYAVDFDGDGRVDLFHSTPDAIGSVANYFKAFNWQPGLPTHYPVRFDPTTVDLEALLIPDILPTFSSASLAAKGAVIEAAHALPAGPYALIELQNGPDAAQYVVGTDNFYAITRYNWSSYYAMAVIELGQAVRLRIK
jgi:membrane-bound lytic murein transglycosylase B